MAVKVVDLPSETGPTEDDLLMIRENSTGTTRKMTIADFLDAFSYRFVPIGSVLPFGGGTAPDGYLICDGSAVDRTEYAALFDVVGTNFGPGNGVDTFNLPDMRGRVAVGKAASGTFNTINNSGGAETHALTVNEIPSHSHTGSTSTNGNHTHQYTRTTQRLTKIQNPADNTEGVGDYYNPANTSTDGNHNHSFTTNPSGGGQAHNNLQPYRVLNYMIKV